jgi:hypothetical protein
VSGLSVSALQLLGAVLVVSAIAFSIGSAWLLWRATAGSGVLDGMVQVVFLPEKRRLYLQLMSVEGALFVLAGLVAGLTLLGVLPTLPAFGAFAILFVAAIGLMSWRTALGLRPTRLTRNQLESVQRELPGSLPGLAFIPLPPGSEEEAASRRLFVFAVSSEAEAQATQLSRRGRRLPSRGGTDEAGSTRSTPTSKPED